MCAWLFPDHTVALFVYGSCSSYSMAVIVRRADLTSPADCDSVLHLLNAYALDPMGGGEPLSEYARSHVIQGMLDMGPLCRVYLAVGVRAQGGAFEDAAFEDGRAVGLANCFIGFSTFKAKRLINIHDFAVLPEFRGKGVARMLMHAIEADAVIDGFCKITLEVLSNNVAAKACYVSCGFTDYALLEDAGTALFWQKKLSS